MCYLSERKVYSSIGNQNFIPNAYMNYHFIKGLFYGNQEAACKSSLPAEARCEGGVNI